MTEQLRAKTWRAKTWRAKSKEQAYVVVLFLTGSRGKEGTVAAFYLYITMLSL